MKITKILAVQRQFFDSGKTRNIAFRLAALDRLAAAIKKYQPQIEAALQADLNKSATEAYMTEIGMTLSELSYVRKHLSGWSRDQAVLTPLAQFHAKSFIRFEPYGVTLIMSPWNYPFMLCMEPLIGAVAAGNCCIIKPSAYAPEVSMVINALITEVFPAKYIAVVEGGREANQELLRQRFDYIFFTGSVAVATDVMAAATRHLTPLTLELGGKSPCIVDATAKLDQAAKRLVFGKFLNSGQTCVAPDYLLVEASVRDEFVGCIIKWLHRMLGDNPITHPDYPRMVNRKHYQRVLALIAGEQYVEGGFGNPETLQIAPTVLTGVTWDSPVMQEEIFGPVLPILTFTNINEVIKRLKQHEKPLALYLFTKDVLTERRILREISFGGGCINDTVMHLATSRMGFGGVGQSGMGSYHGKKSFDTFSHQKSILKKYTWLDLPIRYYPFTRLKDSVIRLMIR